MARIRTIKPIFARHEKLQELESEWPGMRPMLTFCCLWTQCDREGRFEWRPRQLKLDVLPFVDYDLGATMELLAEHDFIRSMRSEGDGTGMFRHGASISARMFGNRPARFRHRLRKRPVWFP